MNLEEYQENILLLRDYACTNILVNISLFSTTKEPAEKYR